MENVIRYDNLLIIQTSYGRVNMPITIYGAQSIALGTYQAIHNLHPHRKIACFLVTKQENNPKQLANLPVLELQTFVNTLSQEEKENTEILIATPESVMQEIEILLDKYGLFSHIRLTSERFAQLMSFYHICDNKFMPLPALLIGCHKAKLHIFMAKFYKDKPLSSEYHLPEWITPIQVGASLCEERLAHILDSDGENISDKNGNYSELTALYWLWKNKLVKKSFDDTEDYYGLCHYRRILDLSEDDSFRLLNNEIDVILPYPMPYEPNIEEHHKRYLKEEDWNAALMALTELQPTYAHKFGEILKQQYLYNYNIVIAKKEILRDYCAWLFPILERVEELSVPKGNERKDRYIGYIGESLETLYFMVNKERLNIVHTGYKFLV